jgi:hypothetical protein
MNRFEELELVVRNGRGLGVDELLSALWMLWFVLLQAIRCGAFIGIVLLVYSLITSSWELGATNILQWAAASVIAGIVLAVRKVRAS